MTFFTALTWAGLWSSAAARMANMITPLGRAEG